MQTNTKTARFWIFHRNSFVRLALVPGQSRSFRFFETTDEGWSAEASTYVHTGTAIHLTATDQGRDCDGRMDRTIEVQAALDQLAAYPCEGLHLPQWTVLDVSQRDHSAEAMGY